jgi:hypothetical protein
VNPRSDRSVVRCDRRRVRVICTGWGFAWLIAGPGGRTLGVIPCSPRVLGSLAQRLQAIGRKVRIALGACNRLASLREAFV